MKMPKLVDLFRRPVDKRALTEEQAAPEMMGVRNVFSGHPSEGLTPQRLGSLLRESETGDPLSYLELAEDMEEKDLHYQAVLGTRKRAVAQLDITVDPADESKEAEADAELVRMFIERDVIQDEIFDILDAVGKGFSITEIIWETSERQWMPTELKLVDPRFIDFDRIDRRTPLLKTAEGLKPLDPFKFIRTEIKAKSGLPIRGGIARGCAWAYLFKNFDIKAWVQFAEIYGQPLRVGKYGPDATDEDRRKLLRAVANIGTDAAAIVPESMMLEFIKADQKNSADMYEKLAEFMERQQSKAVLGQTTTTDAISGGHAVAKEHNEVREDIRDSDKSQVEAVFKRDLVKPLVDLNNGPRKAYPSIRIGRAEQIDPKVFAETAKTAAEIGLPLSITDLYAKTGMRPPESDEDTLGGKPAPTDTPPQKKALARARDAGGDGDLVDELTEQLDDAAAPAMTEMIDQIRDLVGDVDSLEDLAEKLIELYPTIETEQLAGAVRNGLVLSDLRGRDNVENG